MTESIGPDDNVSMSRFQVGQRVTTPHGEGVVDNYERCNDARKGQPPRMVATGRYGVKLDSSPFPSLKDGVAYYYSEELT